MNGCFIIARFLARDGHAQHTQQLLQTLLQTSRNEIGCLFYDLYRDREDQNLFVIVDGWRDRAAFDAHAGSAHVAHTLAALDPHLEGKPVISILDRIA
jgi:quinol monooxygenase YgiN